MIIDTLPPYSYQYILKIMQDGIEGIAFDLDGTLYPNYRFNLMLLPFIIREFRLLSAFGRARIVLRKEQESPDFVPKPENDFYNYQAAVVAKILGKSADQQQVIALQNKIDTLIYKGWEPMFKKVKLYKNALDTLAAFKNAGLKLGLMSDFPPETKLEYLGLSKFKDGTAEAAAAGIGVIWDAVHSSEYCGALKPHSLPFLKLAEAMSLPPEKIMYVGNSHTYDVAGAAGAGMKTAWIVGKLSFGNGFKKPRADFIFKNYRQLYNFVLK